MIEIKIYSTDGSEADTVEVDEALFGGEVKLNLLRQAVTHYEASRRLGTAKTKTRAEKRGSGKKMFRQKGTGRARMGPRRNPIRRGGGHTFAKQARSFRKKMSKRARRAALDSALLARMQDDEVVVIDGLDLDAPKTKTVAQALAACGIDRSCLLALPDRDEVLYKSARNLDRTRVRSVADLNAYDVLWPHRVVLTRPAFEALLEARKS